MSAPRIAALIAAMLLVTALPGRGDDAPPWLVLHAGTMVRVELAPWPLDEGPEAALAASVDSIERYGGDELARPDDALHKPVGVRAVVARLLPDGIALVRGLDTRWHAYARVERLVPEVPPGTALRAAGGFDGFADFFPTLESREKAARRLVTGSRLRAIRLGVAPYDDDASELVRVEVRVLSGSRRGELGWIGVGYTGIPASGALTSPAERACRCRLTAFGSPGQ